MFSWYVAAAHVSRAYAYVMSWWRALCGGGFGGSGTVGGGTAANNYLPL